MKKMYLITQDFPYGHREDSFVGKELPYLQEIFNVSILATEVRSDSVNYCGEVDAQVISVQQTFVQKTKSFIRFITKRECYEEIGDIIKSKKNIYKRIFRALMFGTAAETFHERLKVQLSISEKTEAVFYFYWFDYKCLGLTMYKKKYPNIKIIARTHGYDLYDERELYGKQFFKRQMDRELSRLIFAAQYAKDYYLQNYKYIDSYKYPLHRLGVEAKKKIVEKENSSFLLLSCSNVIDIKRVNLIVEALQFVDDSHLKWVHIGAGDKLDEMKTYAETLLKGKENIEYEFTGELLNEEVIQFYKENSVSCFITTTSTEGGSPVSVQEALSFGVPIIATSVGELPLMVQDNGVLLAENPKAKEVADAISDMLKEYHSEKYYEKCVVSLRIYERMFNEEKNYRALQRDLKML